MNHKDVMRLALQAGFREWHPHIIELFALPSTVERFAEMIASEEREACAQVCNRIALSPSNVILGTALECMHEIRNRGNV